jgi:hypothetical protein
LSFAEKTGFAEELIGQVNIDDCVTPTISVAAYLNLAFDQKKDAAGKLRGAVNQLALGIPRWGVYAAEDIRRMALFVQYQ